MIKTIYICKQCYVNNGWYPRNFFAVRFHQNQLTKPTGARFASFFRGYGYDILWTAKKCSALNVMTTSGALCYVILVQQSLLIGMNELEGMSSAGGGGESEEAVSTLL